MGTLSPKDQQPCRRLRSVFNASARRRRPLPSPSARLVRASSRSTAALCSSFSPRSCASRSTSLSSSLASISSPTSTSACASLVVVKLRRSTPSARLSPSPSSPPTTVGASPRSSAVPAPVRVTRSLTVKESDLWGDCAAEEECVFCSGRYSYCMGDLAGVDGNSESTYLLARGRGTRWPFAWLALGGFKGSDRSMKTIQVHD